jgi:hypothetical protein
MVAHEQILEQMASGATNIRGVQTCPRIPALYAILSEAASGSYPFSIASFKQASSVSTAKSH